MPAVHCHFCGGVINDAAAIQYRPPRASAQLALPRDGACECTPPVVYEDPPVIGAPPDEGTS